MNFTATANSTGKVISQANPNLDESVLLQCALIKIGGNHRQADGELLKARLSPAEKR
jgi:hypothetical protein